MDDRTLLALLEATEAQEPAVLALVTDTAGSAPQVRGAALVLRADGSLCGTVGGGRFELCVVDEARKLLAEGGPPRKVVFDLLADLGMQCGGRMEAYLELRRPLPRLVIFGAGHVGREVARMAAGLDFDRVVYDDRPDMATEERFPGCRLIVAPFAEAGERVTTLASDFLLIVTHGHKHDQALLETFVAGPHQYLGMIGSRRKVARALESLREQAVPPEAVAAVHSPVGISIGARTPAEIAVSILAEMIQVRRGLSDSDLSQPPRAHAGHNDPSDPEHP